MTTSNSRLLRARLVWMQYHAMYEARRAVKGVRMGNIWGINLLGQYGEGIRVSEAAKITGEQRHVIHGRLQRLCIQGLAYKTGKFRTTKYHLSESGQLFYDKLNERICAGMDEIIQSLMEEARRRL